MAPTKFGWTKRQTIMWMNKVTLVYPHQTKFGGGTISIPFFLKGLFLEKRKHENFRTPPGRYLYEFRAACIPEVLHKI